MDGILNGQIDRLEGDYAVVVLEDGQKINWPVTKFTEEPRAGAVIKLYLESRPAETINKEDMAKNFLNEILQNEEL